MGLDPTRLGLHSLHPDSSGSRTRMSDASSPGSRWAEEDALDALKVSTSAVRSSGDTSLARGTRTVTLSVELLASVLQAHSGPVLWGGRACTRLGLVLEEE